MKSKEGSGGECWATRLIDALGAAAAGNESLLHGWMDADRRSMLAYLEGIGADRFQADESATNVVYSLWSAFRAEEGGRSPIRDKRSYVLRTCVNALRALRRSIARFTPVDPQSSMLEIVGEDCQDSGGRESQLVQKLRALIPRIQTQGDQILPQPAKEIIAWRVRGKKKAEIFQMLSGWLDPPIGKDECDRRWVQASTLLKELLDDVDINKEHPGLYSKRNRFHHTPPPPWHEPSRRAQRSSH